jgi:hypothetical protein
MISKQNIYLEFKPICVQVSYWENHIYGEWDIEKRGGWVPTLYPVKFLLSKEKVKSIKNCRAGTMLLVESKPNNTNLQIHRLNEFFDKFARVNIVVHEGYQYYIDDLKDWFYTYYNLWNVKCITDRPTGFMTSHYQRYPQT